MAKAQSLLDAINEFTLSADQSKQVMDEVMMVAFPMPLVKALSDEAARRNLTFGQLLARCINECISKNESAVPSASRRLLTEG